MPDCSTGTLVAALVLTLAAAPAAFATPERRICTDCHSLDPAVTVRASFLGCSGGNATYSVRVSDTHANGEGWAVFNGTTNTVNGFSPASSQFTVAAGRSYTVRGVSDGANRGGSAAVTISPVCNACTPAVEACDDGIETTATGSWIAATATAPRTRRA